jgi:hypothetical protein
LDVAVSTRDGERVLSFRYPDTDELLQAPDDDRTLAGPAAIAVTRPGDPLPCALAATPCAAHSGLVACADVLLADDGACSTTPHPTFPHFVALPPPNDYQGLCVDPSPPCTALASEVRFTTDVEGNVLIPMDWQGILTGRAVPVARLLRGRSPVEAFAGGGASIRIPGDRFLASYSLEGGLLPPIFDPQFDPTAVDTMTVFGSADAPASVLRITRRSPQFTSCAAGANAGLPCTDDLDCGGATCGPATCHGPQNQDRSLSCASDGDCSSGDECGPALFEFRDRFVDGAGPVVIRRFAEPLRPQPGVCQAGDNAGARCTLDGECPQSRCVLYALEALDPVPLDGLIETDQLFSFVLSERIEGLDANGDGDADDSVLILTDRRTGLPIPLGTPTGCGITGMPAGRAVVRVRQPPFSYPAVAAAQDLVAFLESEIGEGACDQNGDGDAVDTILRVFRTDGREATRATTPLRAVDAAPVVQHRSVAISDGLVFFRSSEQAGARHATDRVSVSSAGAAANGVSSEPALSGNGRYVAFASRATNLVAGDTNGFEDVFLRDRVTGVTERVSITSTGLQGNEDSWNPALSADARVVAFESFASLVPEDTNDRGDVYVHDRNNQTTARVSVGPGGAQADDSCFNTSLSADGRFVAFECLADNLVVGDTNGVTDVFVHDRRTGLTERVSLAADGGQVNQASFNPRISGDGSLVAYARSIFAPFFGSFISAVHLWPERRRIRSRAPHHRRGEPRFAGQRRLRRERSAERVPRRALRGVHEHGAQSDSGRLQRAA